MTRTSAGAEISRRTRKSQGVDYIEVPLLFRVHFGGRERILFLLGGPSIAFKTSCGLRDQSGNVTVSYDCDAYSFPYINNSDIGGMLGVGLSHRHMTISIRDDIGFSNILSSTYRTLADEPGVSLKNQALSLMVGITLGK